MATKNAKWSKCYGGLPGLLHSWNYLPPQHVTLLFVTKPISLIPVASSKTHWNQERAAESETGLCSSKFLAFSDAKGKAVSGTLIKHHVMQEYGGVEAGLYEIWVSHGGENVGSVLLGLTLSKYSALKMEILRFSETLVCTLKSRWRSHNLEYQQWQWRYISMYS
jgi:hypothetical protein